MRPLISNLFVLSFALLALGSCTNDESDEGLEVLTPNDPAETSISMIRLQNRNGGLKEHINREESAITRS